MDSTVNIKFKKEHQKDAGVSEHVPFSFLLAPNIVLNEDRSLVATWRLDGISFESKDATEIQEYHRKRQQLLKALGGEISVWTHRLHREIVDELSIDYPHILPKAIAQNYYRGLEKEPLMAHEYFFTIVYRPEHQIKFLKKNVNLEDVRNEQINHLEKMFGFCQLVDSALSDFGGTRLSVYEHNGKQFSTQLEFYSYLLNGTIERVPILNGRIANYLPTSRLFFEEEMVELRDPIGQRYAAMLVIKEFPAGTEPGINDALLYADFEYIETQSFKIFQKNKALAAVKLQQRRMTGSEDLSPTQVDALTEALDEVQQGNLLIGKYHYTLAVFGETLAQTRENLANARKAMSESGFVTILLDLVADAAWFAQLPGNHRYLPVDMMLNSKNFSGMATFHGFPIGKRNGNPWGEAVTLLRTQHGAPYFFNWHYSNPESDDQDKKLPGNTLITGKTGSGKTTILMFLIMMTTKFIPSIFLFDKDRGAEIAIRAFGGNYLTFKRSKATGLQPLQLEPTAENREFLKKLFSALIPRVLSPSEEADLVLAIDTVLGFPFEARRFFALHQMLPVKNDEDSLSSHLRKWCHGQELGWVLDNPANLIDLKKNKVNGFDDTDLLTMEEALTPVTMMLLHLMEQSMDGSRMIYVMDEFWSRLRNSAMADFVYDKQYTIRKKNGIGVFGTQSPEQILNTKLAGALVEQCATQIFLANPSASYRDYVEGFQISQSEFETIKNFDMNDRLALIRQDDHSAIVSMDFKNLGSGLLDILSGSEDNVKLLDEIREKHGDDPREWLSVFKERLEERRSKSKKTIAHFF